MTSKEIRLLDEEVSSPLLLAANSQPWTGNEITSTCRRAFGKVRALAMVAWEHYCLYRHRRGLIASVDAGRVSGGGSRSVAADAIE